MARSTARSMRKPTGGRYHQSRSKKSYELAGFPANTKLSTDRRTHSVRGIGGNSKQVNLSTNIINVTDKKGKTTKTQILNVVGNPANPQLVIRNIMTKGAIVETKMGKAKITSRPGQHGTLSGVLV